MHFFKTSSLKGPLQFCSQSLHLLAI